MGGVTSYWHPQSGERHGDRHCSFSRQSVSFSFVIMALLFSFHHKTRHPPWIRQRAMRWDEHEHLLTRVKHSLRPRILDYDTQHWRWIVECGQSIGHVVLDLIRMVDRWDKWVLPPMTIFLRLRYWQLLSSMVDRQNRQNKNRRYIEKIVDWSKTKWKMLQKNEFAMGQSLIMVWGAGFTVGSWFIVASS